MHLVDEKHLLVAEVGQDRREVALDLQGRPGSLLEGYGQFVGDDGGERGLAEPRRPVEQDVIQGFAARTCGLDGNRQVLFDLGLPDKFCQPLGPQLQLKRRIVLDRSCRNDSLLKIGNIFGGSH